MKFIGNFYLCFIGFATIWVVVMLFTSGASIYTWIVVILLAATTTFINDRNEGKHDK